MSDVNERFVNKLIDSFEDVKERLIRIEENVKDVKSVKTDVEDLKIKYAALESKSSSAHKRIDTMDGEVDKRVSKIEANLNKAVWIVLTAVILAIIGLVVVVPKI